MHGIGAQSVGAPRIKGAVRRDVHRVRRAGRFGDTELAHIGPEADAILKATGGAGTRNPDTGAKEHFKLKDLISFAAPIVTNVLFPGAGSAIGGALGLSGAAANVAGNALLGGGIGALTGGKRGALVGAGTGAALAGFREMGGLSGIGERLGIGGGAPGGGAAAQPMAEGRDLLQTEINPTVGDAPVMPVAPPPPQTTGLGAVAATAPSVRGAAGVPAGTTADKPGVDWSKLALLGGGALLLGGVGGPEQQDEPEVPPSLAAGFGGPLPKYQLDRTYAVPTDADLLQFGRGYKGRAEGTFYDAPGRYKQYRDGGSVRASAERLEGMGRNGDSMLAHITPEEAALLKAAGGAGTVNPKTGLLEFYDSSFDGGGYGNQDAGFGGANPSGGGDQTGGQIADLSPQDQAEIMGFDSFAGGQGPAGPAAMPTYGEQAGFMGRLGDRAMGYVQDAIARPAETGINALVGLTPLGGLNMLAGALTGWNAGRAATSIAQGLGAPTGAQTVGVSSPVSTDMAGGGDGIGASAPRASLVTAPTLIEQLAAAAPTPAAPQSRQARMPSNAELMQFGRGYGGIGQGTFYDAPNTVRAKDGGEISDGRSDDIPAVLSHGEHVLDAEFISLVGNGDNDAGHKKIEKWKSDLRRQKGRALAKGKISPDAKIPKVA